MYVYKERERKKKREEIREQKKKIYTERKRGRKMI